MSALTHYRLSNHVLDRLINDASNEPRQLTDDHRRSLSARLRAVGAVEHRRLDAWVVENAGRPSSPFHWSPSSARRVLAGGALRRRSARSCSTLDAVDEEIDDVLARAARAGHPGSLPAWLASCTPGGLAVVRAEAATWATHVDEVAASLRAPWAYAPSDAYYDVARARTTLRGRRDLIVSPNEGRVLIRVRPGAPGRSAGAGLRADLTIDALADPDGLASRLAVGVWPEAGVVLVVEGTMSDLRAGGRDLVRAAVALRSRAERSAA